MKTFNDNHKFSDNPLPITEKSAADVGRRGRGRGEDELIAEGPSWTTAILSATTEQAHAARESCVLDQDR
jgi:hypothetical protein